MVEINSEIIEGLRKVVDDPKVQVYAKTVAAETIIAIVLSSPHLIPGEISKIMNGLKSALKWRYPFGLSKMSLNELDKVEDQKGFDAIRKKAYDHVVPPLRYGNSWS